MKIKQLLELECSYFDNTYSKPTAITNISALFDGSLSKNVVKPPGGKSITSKELDALLVDEYKANGKSVKYNAFKEMQCAVTPSGLFGERRTYEYLQEANPLMVIDIDNTKADKKYVDSFKKYPWVVGAGQSVSRQGVWVLIYIADTALMKEHFLALRKIFTKSDDLKDTTRLRYISYGYSWHRPLKESIKPFTDTVALPIEDIYETKQLPSTNKYDNDETVQQMLAVVGSIEETGGLHPWAIRIAARCNRKGITSKFGQQSVWKHIKDLPIVKDTARYTQERFNDSWSSVYDTYKHEHHIETKVKISRSRVSRFNHKIYAKSPSVLKELIETVEQDEEKEVVYFTAIILLGTLFPNRAFRYFNNTYYPNLYGYILGEAASFKGKAKIVRQAMRPYQDIIDATYKDNMDKRSAAIQWNKANKDNKQEINKVPDLNLFFDGNTSSAAMLKAMQDSPVLIMFETEGDTITKTWKTDWGNYSDILRKAFEHESLYSLKKNGNEENLLRIHIQNPKLSVLVSSTEQQMRKVLNADETENGLMSRFLFYVVQNDKKWYNGWESNTDVDLASILQSRLAPDVWLAFTTQDDIHFEMSKEAYQYHQDYFNYVNDNWPDELFVIIALIRRAGTACARIALLIEELNTFDNEPKGASGKRSAFHLRRHTVSGESMLLAIDIMKVLLQHLFVAWQITYKSEDLKPTNVQEQSTRDAVLKALTDNPLAGYGTIAKEVGISKSLARYHKKKIDEDGGRGAV